MANVRPMPVRKHSAPPVRSAFWENAKKNVVMSRMPANMAVFATLHPTCVWMIPVLVSNAPMPDRFAVLVSVFLHPPVFSTKIVQGNNCAWGANVSTPPVMQRQVVRPMSFVFMGPVCLIPVLPCLATMERFVRGDSVNPLVPVYSANPPKSVWTANVWPMLVSASNVQPGNVVSMVTASKIRVKRILAKVAGYVRSTSVIPIPAPPSSVLRVNVVTVDNAQAISPAKAIKNAPVITSVWMANANPLVVTSKPVRRARIVSKENASPILAVSRTVAKTKYAAHSMESVSHCVAVKLGSAVTPTVTVKQIPVMARIAKKENAAIKGSAFPMPVPNKEPICANTTACAKKNNVQMICANNSNVQQG